MHMRRREAIITDENYSSLRKSLAGKFALKIIAKLKEKQNIIKRKLKSSKNFIKSSTFRFK